MGSEQCEHDFCQRFKGDIGLSSPVGRASRGLGPDEATLLPLCDFSTEMDEYRQERDPMGLSPCLPNLIRLRYITYGLFMDLAALLFRSSEWLRYAKADLAGLVRIKGLEPPKTPPGFSDLFVAVLMPPLEAIAAAIDGPEQLFLLSRIADSFSRLRALDKVITDRHSEGAQ